MKSLIMNIREYDIIKPIDIFDDSWKTDHKMYAIISVQKLYFKKPESIDGGIRLFFRDNNGHQYSCDCEIPFDGDSKTVEVKSTFPCEDIKIDDKTISATELYISTNSFEREFKIEYIGISTVDAKSRLSLHGTLQKILSDFASNHIDRYIYIVLFDTCHFEIRTIGNEEIFNIKKPTEQDYKNFIEQFNASYEETDIITALSEASLINYFKPHYNTEYKNSDSKAKFSTLKTLYQYKYEEAHICFQLYGDKRDKPFTFYTETASIKFDASNNFNNVIDCPFEL